MVAVPKLYRVYWTPEEFAEDEDPVEALLQLGLYLAVHNPDTSIDRPLTLEEMACFYFATSSGLNTAGLVDSRLSADKRRVFMDRARAAGWGKVFDR